MVNVRVVGRLTAVLGVAVVVAGVVILSPTSESVSANQLVTAGISPGSWNSLALDAGGNPVYSYMEAGPFDLKVVHCGNLNCTAGNAVATPDSTGQVGDGSSLVLDASGNPVISYNYNGADDLKVLHCGNPHCSSGNSVATPDTTGTLAEGGTSIALDQLGYPVVAYKDSTAGSLKVLHCGDENCQTGNTITTPVTANVDGVPSMALDSFGNPVISYGDSASDALTILHCGDPVCSSGNVITTPDIGGGVGGDARLALDASGKPVVAYINHSLSRLKVLHCGDVNCSAGNSIVTADVNGQHYPSLTLDASGFPVVAYRGASGRTIVLHCGDANCTAGSSITTPFQGAGGSVGGTSIRLDDGGNPVILFADYDANVMRLLDCSNPNCSGAVTVSTDTPTGTPSSTPTPAPTQTPTPTVSTQVSVSPTPTPSITPVAPPPPVTGDCGEERPRAAGTTVEYITADGANRQYTLYVPSTYGNGTDAHPLVFLFHGILSNSTTVLNASEMIAKAELEGFILVAPQAAPIPYGYPGLPAWSYGLPAWNLGADPARANDVIFVGAILDRLQLQMCVDAARVYSSGHSMGAMMSVRLACDIPGRIAAIAAMGGLVYPVSPATCPGVRPVPVIAFHGTADTYVPIDGGPSALFGAAAFAPLESQVMPAWAAHNGCSPTPSESVPVAGVRVIEYPACTNGATTELWVVEGGGHQWLGGTDYPVVPQLPSLGANTTLIDGTDLLWNFFLGHPFTESVSGAPGPGGTVTTDTEGDGATGADPVEASVTSPSGGAISIVSVPASSNVPGYDVLGTEFDISAPPATTTNPLTIVLTLDSSAIPSGATPSTMVVFRNGTPVPDCTGTAGTAAPDPCVSSRAFGAGGDIEITVLTSTASVWVLAVNQSVGGVVNVIADHPPPGQGSDLWPLALAAGAIGLAAMGGWRRVPRKG
jgi:poly(3-hydroxybutyrate) depolymerase